MRAIAPVAAGPYTIADIADDLAGVLQNLNIGPTYVMGWSMGGFIALERVLRHPALVEKLILWGGIRDRLAQIAAPTTEQLWEENRGTSVAYR